MKKQIDIESWPRKEHFKFFSGFEEPFFGVTVLVDCAVAYKHAKTRGYSLDPLYRPVACTEHEA